MRDGQHDNLLVQQSKVDGIGKAMEADPPDLAINALERFGCSNQQAECALGFLAELGAQAGRCCSYQRRTSSSSVRA